MHFEGGGGEAALMSSGDMVFSEEMPRVWKIFLTQCRNLETFLSLRFYVKSILVHSKSAILSF